MSKRSRSQTRRTACQLREMTPRCNSVPAVKLRKVEDIFGGMDSVTPSFSTSETQNCMSVDDAKPTFKKIKVLQTYVLNKSPHIAATISLNGTEPEVRFITWFGTITLTAEEFIELCSLKHLWPEHPVPLLNTRIEPTKDGGVRFAQYVNDNPLNFLPTDLVEMPMCAVYRFKSELQIMEHHVKYLQGQQSSVALMFACIVDVYLCEHRRSSLFRPTSANYEQLSRIVEAHIPSSEIVGLFRMNQGICSLNLYSLLSCTLAQKTYIYDLLNKQA